MWLADPQNEKGQVAISIKMYTWVSIKGVVLIKLMTMMMMMLLLMMTMTTMTIIDFIEYTC